MQQPGIPFAGAPGFARTDSLHSRLSPPHRNRVVTSSIHSMPSAEPFTLTQEQHDLVCDAGDRLPPKKVEDGTRLRQRGGVTDVRWVTAGQTVQAKVGSALLYRVLLTFTPPRPEWIPW